MHEIDADIAELQLVSTPCAFDEISSVHRYPEVSW
jgi:hypothetical protein